jgi:hypothetical protein
VLTGCATLDSPMQMTDGLVLVVSPEKYIDLIGDAAVETLDTFGPRATILTGQLASIYGIPVVVSEFISNDMHTTGLYTGASTKSGMVLFNRNRFVRLVRRGAMIEQAKDITRGVINVVATVRELPIATWDSSTKKNVYYGYNI